MAELDTANGLDARGALSPPPPLLSKCRSTWTPPEVAWSVVACHTPAGSSDRGRPDACLPWHGRWC
jgi:hypothetical protein